MQMVQRNRKNLSSRLNIAEAIEDQALSISGGKTKANTTMPTTSTASTKGTMANWDVAVTTSKSIKRI